MARIFYTNGTSIKNIDFPQYPDSAWEFITGDTESRGQAELYSTVAAIFRAVNISARALANLPFALVGSGGTDFDNSDTWENNVGFMPNPKELIRLWRMSLFMTNTAYGFMEVREGKQNLRYLVPTSITPLADSEKGLIGFKRTIGTKSVTYNVKDGNIVYLWNLDHTTELLPSPHSEFKACMAAGNAIYYSDYFIQTFFQRGGIKPSMLMVKGVPTPEERVKIEGVWDKLQRGFYKYLGKVFNAESISVTPIGEGIDNLKDSALHNEKIADIALAAGIPLSILLANSANYATANQEYVSWYRDSIAPWAEFIAGVLNEQIFNRLGLRFEFRPEMTDPGQEDEVQRANAYATYVSSGMKPSVAAQIVGVELPSGMEYADLDPKETVGTEASTDEEPVIGKFIPTIKQVRELDTWRTIVIRKFKAKEDFRYPFEPKELPDSISNYIKYKLARAKGFEDIDAAFKLDLIPAAKPDNDLELLTASLNRIAEMKPNVIVNMPAELTELIKSIKSEPVTDMNVEPPDQMEPAISGMEVGN